MLAANKNESPKRGPGRQWQPGQSGNPSGRPKVIARLRDLARAYTEEAILTLAECLKDPDGRIRVAAANALLDRGWGKPVQPTEEQPETEKLSEMSDEELRKLVIEQQ